MTSSTSRSSRLAIALGLALTALVGPVVTPSVARAAPAIDGNKAAEIALKAGQAFRAGKYKEAADLFLEAYRLSLRPAQLRNAARAFEEGGMLDPAAEHWTRYRDHAGLSADERAEADAHVKLIAERKRSAEILRAAEAARQAAEVASAAATAARQEVDAVRAAEAQRTAELTAQAPPPETNPVPGYVLAGTGAAAALTGTILWFVASGQLSDVDERIAQRDLTDHITGISASELDSEVSSINAQRVASGVLFTAGLTLAAAGVLWLVLDDGEPEPGGPRIETRSGW